MKLMSKKKAVKLPFSRQRNTIQKSGSQGRLTAVSMQYAQSDNKIHPFKGHFFGIAKIEINFKITPKNDRKKLQKFRY